MKEITISSLGGLMNQMYTLNSDVLSDKGNFFQNNYFDINSLFWNTLFSEKNVTKLVEELKFRNESSPNNDITTKEKAIINNPQAFLKQFKNAKSLLLDNTLTPQQTYTYLETFQMVCMLHTKLKSNPFRLNIENGYLRSKSSSYEMYYNCLLLHRNPYLTFLQEKIMPIILSEQPDIMFFSGQPNIATFAIARLVKKKLPNTYLVINNHSNEFYSMNKIIPLLKKNDILFCVFNCIILDNSLDTLRKLKNSNLTRNNLREIPNIIFSADNGKTITQTKLSHAEFKKEPFYTNELQSESGYPINIKLFPENYCYWKKCSFCGINSKYLYEASNDWHVERAIENISKIKHKKIDNFWFLDEAIPPAVLCKFSEMIIEKNITLKWHARCRIEEAFLSKDLCKLLINAGLKHILFGFESASDRILKLMNKTPLSNYLDVAEKIVKNFTECGVSVHFPSIIGYPSETENERAETYNFLEYLYTNYTLFTYNINILNLDITSKMFKKFVDYNITDIHFPCNPKYFMENFVDWECSYLPVNYESLQSECEKAMLHQYPWFPNGSLLNINSFYLLWEHMRGCFRNKNTIKKTNLKILQKSKIFILNSMVSLFVENEDLFGLYNFENHHIILGGEIIKKVVYMGDGKYRIQDLLNFYPLSVHNKITELLTELIQLNFIFIY